MFFFHVSLSHTNPFNRGCDAVKFFHNFVLLIVALQWPSREIIERREKNISMAAFPNQASAYIVGIVVGAFVGILVIVAAGMCIYKQRRVGENLKLVETEVNELREEAAQRYYKQPVAPRSSNE